MLYLVADALRALGTDHSTAGWLELGALGLAACWLAGVLWYALVEQPLHRLVARAGARR
ncbi:MAG TPA: hypothetical protein VF331_15775 [Polyangiales bacterium]